MKALKWINGIALAATIAVNALANLLPIGGNTTGQFSAAYPNLFTPAPVTFAVWGVIYLALAAFALYQSGILDENDRSAHIRTGIGLWFAVSCAFNIAWILCWHLGAIGWSVVCMSGLLLSLSVIERRIAKVPGDRLSNLMVKPAFDIYFGWIIAAAIANVSVWLAKLGWNGFGLPDTFWTVIMLLVGTAIGCLVMIAGNKWLATSAVIWAYVGILIRHVSASGFSGAYPVVIGAVLLGICVMFCTIIAYSGIARDNDALHEDAAVRYTRA